MLRKGHDGLYKAPTQEGKGKRKSKRREIRSISLTLDLKDDKLYDSGNQKEGEIFHKLHVLGTNDNL